MIASASVIGSAIYYMIETRHQPRIRQTESIIQLSPWFNIDAKESKKQYVACAPQNTPATKIILTNTLENPNKQH